MFTFRERIDPIKRSGMLKNLLHIIQATAFSAFF